MNLNFFGIYLEIQAEFAIFRHMSHSTIWTSALSILTFMSSIFYFLQIRQKTGHSDIIFDVVRTYGQGVRKTDASVRKPDIW
jgi:hypothetical protein